MLKTTHKIEPATRTGFDDRKISNNQAQPHPGINLSPDSTPNPAPELSEMDEFEQSKTGTSRAVEVKPIAR
jgi:hypothetical protein